MGLFSKQFKGFTSWIDPAAAAVGRETGIADYFVKKNGPPPPPGPPNQNDAANAAQGLTDQLRMRRGLMANIYAGASQNSGTPVTGKTTLG